jgi:hypothetical protein
MRNLPAVLVAGALLVLVAGCAQQANPGGPALAISTPPTASAGVASGAIPNSRIVTVHPGLPMAGHLPPDAVPVPANQVDASTLPSRFSNQVWSEDGGTVLGLVGEQGGCQNTTATLVSQTATDVTIRLAAISTGGSGTRACPMYLTYKPMTVALAAPLGRRTVVLRTGG